MRLIYITCLAALFTACVKETFIEGRFKGARYSNHKSIEFSRNGTFKIVEFNDTTAGKYEIYDGFVVLNYSDFYGNNKSSKFKIVSTECIRDFDNAFYCTDEETSQKLNEAEFKFRDEIVAMLDTLREVRLYRDALVEINRDYFKKYPYQGIVSDLYVDYLGIDLVDNEEFHVFLYVKPDTSGSREYFVRFLVHKNPLEIYSVADTGRSMKSIYKANF